MKALTLTQPWALVAVGAKTIETRSWRTHHRGPLAIHAAQGLAPAGGESGLIAWLNTEPFASALAPHLSGYTVEERAADLPRGGIVAVVTVETCIPTEEVPALYAGHKGSWEHAFGDYRPGRWAWVFERRLNIYDPIECKGAMGLWTVPEEVRHELARITDMAWTEEETQRINAAPEMAADDDPDGYLDSRRQAITEMFGG